jgi:MoxR-like ATPase
VEVLRKHHSGADPHDLDAAGVRRVAGPEDLTAAAKGATAVTVADELLTYVQALAAETRRSPSLSLGASTRGAAMLLVASKAWAYLSGREYLTPDDVKALVKPAWRHRVILRPEVELEGASSDRVLDSIVQRVPAPR